ncbi:hypothetical protein JMF97_01320 [Micromonospora fiedleri]|uniref:Uncharacterized protein n=1 Tax=Micromonospora fiedleri TaxID=1157498 RepID=A0ABS1UF30_9ACTN|nr:MULTISPECIES: hypothetical protein [Micromonospora]MBL6274799.1 hypothetical protein [Micromonospora fiedleri]WSK44499.1 hypothetical protein OG712_10420 [Micromonospora maris]
MTRDGTPTEQPATDETIRLRTPRQASTLPAWMLDPPPPRRTLGVRVGQAFAALPGADRLRRRWWAWQDRDRLYQRYPTAFKLVAMVVSWVVVMALVLLVYALYGQI